ncbi:MAG: hypothetical protein H5T59_11525, partial [Anaerolineae bacterium]|nr:hypothetical protein [Anaerolineae bacterium]
FPPTPSPTPTSSPTPSPLPVAQGRHFRDLALARGLDDENQPVGEGKAFRVDDRPVYAIFRYQGMRNGMEWSQQWWRDDDMLWEGKGPWEWGTAGRAWVYFTPEFGWTVGRYQVRLYVEGQLEQVADFTME